jgi:hypothetical protein
MIRRSGVRSNQTKYKKIFVVQKQGHPKIKKPAANLSILHIVKPKNILFCAMNSTIRLVLFLIYTAVTKPVLKWAATEGRRMPNE